MGTGQFVKALTTWTKTAWWGLVKPRLLESEPLIVLQAAILREHAGEEQVLLSVRSDVRGWELPGGQAIPGERFEAAVEREVWEETGLRVRAVSHVGDYVRTGFRPHTARVYRCQVVGGELRPSRETPLVRWFRTDRVPSTLFPWYHAPLADALADARDTGRAPVERHDRQGLAAIWAGISIDFRMRRSNDRAGLPD